MGSSVNAFVLKGSEPMLVETGAAIQRADFMETRFARSSIPPISGGSGSVTPISTTSACTSCSRKTRLRVLTTFLGMGIIG